LTRELEVAVAAAEAAGEVLRNGFGQHQQVKYKGEVDLVTKADEDAEQAIKQVLQETFPHYGMLAEEGGELKGEGDVRWIVDPLDGTTNYTHGLPLFCTANVLADGLRCKHYSLSLVWATNLIRKSLPGCQEAPTKPQEVLRQILPTEMELSPSGEAQT
jgi:hypothetical protein